ncbi:MULTISPECIES: allantoinase PuuE [Acinetobacter]|uniref:allantoinase PuuE n=1 Tax=Acinetobacter TaxID=469 RepID=UPI001FBADBF3|nr:MULTISPECIES: allantoinase PuuE [Acinetobacter]MDI1223779.1 allantoinase PuuE [Acinetobacter sp.]UOH16581.1 allantoinase PuuE [Acinetobacter sp. NyZ410]
MSKTYLRGQDLIDQIQNTPYSRDLIGYHGEVPKVAWPNQAQIAVQFVLNYEEGAENHIEHGDAGSEQFLSDIVGAASFPDKHMSMDSMYEYGARAGFWRIHQEFKKRNLPMTIFGVGMALARNPYIVEAIQQAHYDVISHGQRWLNYQTIDIETERQHIDQAISILETLFGTTPMGWYTGRDSPNTRKLLAEFPQIKYDCDYYGDDLPFWTSLTNLQGQSRPHLIIPYTLESNDMKFCAPAGFNSGEQFYQYLKDAFDVLYAEGETEPKMLSIGMHCRILGRPGRFKALQRFLDYIQTHEKVWICRRGDIAEHWFKHHPAA